MAALATVADAVAIYGEDYVIKSCDRTRSKTLDYEAMGAALDRASNVVFSILAGRVPIPSPTPSHFIKFVVDLAIYDVSASEAGIMTENKRKLRDDAMEWLWKLAKNQVSDGAAKDTPTLSAVEEPIAVDPLSDASPFSVSEMRKVL